MGTVIRGLCSTPPPVTAARGDLQCNTAQSDGGKERRRKSNAESEKIKQMGQAGTRHETCRRKAQAGSGKINAAEERRMKEETSEKRSNSGKD